MAGKTGRDEGLVLALPRGVSVRSAAKTSGYSETALTGVGKPRASAGTHQGCFGASWPGRNQANRVELLIAAQPR
jgi:hypothetical protein